MMLSSLFVVLPQLSFAEDSVINDDQTMEHLEPITHGDISEIISGRSPLSVKNAEKEQFKEILDGPRAAEEVFRAPAIIDYKQETKSHSK